MAIIKMKRFSALTLKDGADSLISSLQLLRCADLTLPQSFDPESAGLVPEKQTEKLAELRKKLAAASATEEFLASFLSRRSPLFSPPKEVSLDSVTDSVYSDSESKCLEGQRLMGELSKCKTSLASVNNEIESLIPWSGTAVPLPESETVSCRSVSGTLPVGVAPEQLDSNLCEMAAVTEALRQGERETYIRLTAHKDDFAAAHSILCELGFIPCPCRVTEHDGFADGKITSLRADAEALEKRIDSIKAAAKELAENIDDVKLYCDLISNEIARVEASERMFHSQRTVLVTGWVPEPSVPKVAALLDERGDAYSFDDAGPEDNVPVKLSNNPFSSQFEPVIELYSLPAYGSFDPTSVMSVFFFIIFGMMLADVGYGLLMSAICLLGLRLMKPRGSMKKMLKMFAWCGVSCAVMGVLFGGYFSDAPSSIMQNWFGVESPPELALWMNPMTEPMSFLVVSLVVGALHLVTALMIKFYVLWKSGKRLDAVCDAGSWIVLFLGAGLFFIYRPAGAALAALGVLMLIFTQGRAQKNIFMKLFKGIASLYDIVGYISDLLSYSRILSLGLASMVIGSVFNILGTMPGLTPVGLIFFFVIFTVGHLLNMAINMLGSFVHTARLQYIEFFGKFYEDGGRPFDPLTPHSKYVLFK